jgi:PIN domain nuclease of toxin-antitoxin system
LRLLLDTQVALWWLTGSRKMPRAARTTIERTPCVVSVASLWEVVIKHRIGKLDVTPALFRDAIVEAGALVLSVTDQHVLASAQLPTDHSDPFDRLLLAVAVAERLTLLTADEGLIALAEGRHPLPVQGV